MIETKFKQTEIGLIPEDWEQSSVADLFLHIRSNSLSRDCLNYEDGQIKNVHYGDVLVKLGEITDAEANLLPFVNKDIELPVNPNVLLQSGDVVMADTAEDETAGKSTELINVKSDVVAGLHTIVNRPKQRVFSAKYLGYFFNSTLYHTQLLPHMQGIKVLSLSKKAIDSTIVVYPKDKQEQSRIAEALSDIDKLIVSLSKMIEKKRLMKQGAMQQLLTGKKRLKGFAKSNNLKQTEIGEIPEEWEMKPVSDVANNFTGLTYTPNDVCDYGTLVLRSSNIKDSMLVFSDNVFVNMQVPNRALAQKGDILICVRNGSSALIGKCAYITPKADGMAFGAFMTVLRATNVDSRYLFYVWQDVNTQKQIHETFGATINQITSNDFKRILIAIPVDIREQSAIANVLTTMDNEIESLEEERDKYIRVKEGMMQKLLTGQIRLVETEAKVVAMPKAKGANVHFKRSVLAAEIANRLCEEPTFGHVKMEKLIFLTEHLCHIDTGSHYHRDAAGPYDNTALRSIDKQMKQHQWFALTKKDKGYRYQPMDKRGDHKKYFDKYYASVLPMFDKVIETFKTSSTEQCEIVATLYSAWDDLQHRSQPFTDDDILNEVLNHWHDSKKRISSSRWQKALDWMRKNGFVPTLDDNN